MILSEYIVGMTGVLLGHMVGSGQVSQIVPPPPASSACWSS